jgi:hypothetical protein
MVDSRGVSVSGKSDRRFAIVDGLTRPKAIFRKAGLDTGSFFKSGFAKDQEIISKEKVVDSRSLPRDFQSF